MAIKRPNQDMPSFAEMRKRLSPKADFLGRTAPEPPPAAAPDAPRRPAVMPPAKAPEPSDEPRDAAAARKAGQGAARLAAVPPARRPAAMSAPQAANDAPATAILKGRVHYPAPGHSRAFDAAVQAYGEKEALQLFLKAALAAYADALNAGAVPTAQAEYPRGKGDLNVSRAMDAQAFAKARAMLDPMEMMGAATLAARILRNAMAWRLAQG